MKTKIYAEILENKALQQFNEAMDIDCNVQGALMPDAHTGYTLPIGSVIKSKDFIFPSYVGYDIGCGVSATKLSITKEGLDLDQLKEAILKVIPIGFNRHKVRQDIRLNTNKLSAFALEQLNNIGEYQLGTLGGGNHFIEIGESENDGKLWVVIHSGSRGFGHKIAEYYMKKAAILSAEKFDMDFYFKDFAKNNVSFFEHNPDGFLTAQKKYVERKHDEYIKSIKDFEGHYSFNVNEPEGIAYKHDMDYALQFALLNRRLMSERILSCIYEQKSFRLEDFINQNHNHAEYVDGYVIHRKGATHADKGMMGVIPANMRDGSFIVKGLGNPESLNSSSHGAGRVLSRSQAKKKLDLNQFHDDLVGVVTNHSDETIDESPRAYKDIFEVMRLQRDLVDVVDRELPILNIKG